VIQAIILYLRCLFGGAKPPPPAAWSARRAPIINRGYEPELTEPWFVDIK
jgi:hypothetical protein